MNQGVLAALRTILAMKPRSTDFEGYYGRLLQSSNAYVPTADEARRDVQQQRSNSRTSLYGL